MEDKVIKLAATGFLVLVVAPTVIGVTINAGVGIVNAVNKAMWKHKMKKGVKDGSIVEIDGRYYEVVINEEN